MDTCISSLPTSVLEVQLVGHRTDFLIDVDKQFYKVVEPIYAAVSMREGSHCLTCLPTHGVVCLFRWSSSGARVVAAVGGFTLLFLVREDAACVVPSQPPAGTGAWSRRRCLSDWLRSLSVHLARRHLLSCPSIAERPGDRLSEDSGWEIEEKYNYPLPEGSAFEPGTVLSKSSKGPTIGCSRILHNFPVQWAPSGLSL